MSDVRLVVRDAAREIYGTCHGSTADRLITALTAEPPGERWTPAGDEDFDDEIPF